MKKITFSPEAFKEYNQWMIDDMEIV